MGCKEESRRHFRRDIQRVEAAVVVLVYAAAVCDLVSGSVGIVLPCGGVCIEHDACSSCACAVDLHRHAAFIILSYRFRYIQHEQFGLVDFAAFGLQSSVRPVRRQRDSVEDYLDKARVYMRRLEGFGTIE